MSFSHGNQILWLVYITINNLDSKTWQSQTCLGWAFERQKQKRPRFESQDLSLSFNNYAIT